MSALATFLAGGAWPLLLLVLVAVVALVLLERRRTRRLAELAGERASLLATIGRPSRSLALALTFAGGLLLGILAVLQPVWGEGADPAGRAPVDVVLALDVSRSMLARDHEPSRLARAKAQVRELAQHAEGDRVALVLFAGEAVPFVPLTKDLRSLAEMAELADHLAVPTGGTDLGAAIRVAHDALPRGGAILLITDGGDHGGEGLAAAEAASAQGVTVHALGCGSERGAKIPVEGPAGESYLRDREGREVITRMDGASLSRLVDGGGGVFAVDSGVGSSLVDVYENSVRPSAEPSYDGTREKKQQNRFQWPLAAALILWTIGLWLNERRS